MTLIDLAAVIALATLAPILAVLEALVIILGMIANVLEGFSTITNDVFKRAFR